MAGRYRHNPDCLCAWCSNRGRVPSGTADNGHSFGYDEPHVPPPRRRVWFVTPAHGRVAMTRLCLEQRRRLCDDLAAAGIDASCVVIADDENLAVAAEHGFTGLRRPNVPWQRRWSDGLEWACREGGADYVLPIGSDDWLLPGYLTVLPGPGEVLASARLGLVAPDGRELAVLAHTASQPHNRSGFIPWVIPRGLLQRSGFRPVPDGAAGTEASLANALARATFRVEQVDDLQIVDFKSPHTQQTGYRLTTTVNPVAWRTDAPFARLAEAYPADLVDRMERHYRTGGR